MLAATVFATAGTIHYQTPLLDRIGREFAVDAASAGWVATLSFAGFLAGTLLFVPLGDRFDKRRLILLTLGGLFVALIAMAGAPSLVVLAWASFAVGVGASVSQLVLPLVSELASPDKRGHALGTVLSALFLGVLFARLSAGVVAAHLHWRTVYLGAAAMVLAVGVVVLVRLPHTAPSTRSTYRQLMGSIITLYMAHARLRRAAATQFGLSLCYGAFWATLASMISLFHGLGPAAAGLIGIPGAAGVLIAQPAGRWSDRAGDVPVVKAGCALVVAAITALVLAPRSMLAIVIAAALLDCGVRTSMVANQMLITSSIPEARSRSITIFAAHVWGGNALGAFAATTAFAGFGWPIVCAICFAASLSAFAVAFVANRAAR